MPFAVYLAGPEVFHPDAAAVVETQREVCRRLGVVPISPLDKGDGAGDQTLTRMDRIFAGNIALIDRAEETGSSAERVADHYGPLHTRADGMLADRDDVMVEDFGHPVNLMLVSPATVVLGSFEACIRRVAAEVAVPA